MRKCLVCLIGFCALCGCRKTEPLPADVTCVLQTLQTNPTVRAIGNSRVLLERARALKSPVERREMIRMWRDALLNVPLEKLGGVDEGVAIREICETLNWHVAGAMQEAGCSFEETWNVFCEMVSWLNQQIARHNPKGLKKPATRREALVQWTTYQFLSETRENLIEYIEINRLDARLYPNDNDKLETARQRLAILIGRPVRRSDEIKSLGFYTKQVSRRIQDECKAALRDMQ